MTLTPLDVALSYITRSWATVPVPFKGKKPDGALGDGERGSGGDGRPGTDGDR